MEAQKKMVVKDILTLEDKGQFVIPIYQREYKWSQEQCSRILSDMKSCIDYNKEHYIGSIVYQCFQNKKGEDNLQKLYVVDGQQRITTILLFAKALNLLACENPGNPDCYDVITTTNKILSVEKNGTKLGNTLEPSENDQKAFGQLMYWKSYSKLLSDTTLSKDNLMFQTLKIGYTTFKEWLDSGLNIKKDIYDKAFTNLSCVEISLSKEENAQEIFESINSLGMALENSDLIRNYLLMSCENQNALYKNLWKPMQDELIGSTNMESFIRDYLMMKQSRQIESKNVYHGYVDYVLNEYKERVVDKEALLDDLHHCALVYQSFLRFTKEDKDIDYLMKEFRDMDQTTCNPFLLRVFLDYKDNVIPKETLKKVINLLIVYLTRRTLCSIPTSSLRGFMVTLYQRVFGKNPQNKERYYEAIYAFLHKTNTRDRMPTVEETRKRMNDYPLYLNRKFATYLLFRIENGRYPKVLHESAGADNVSVEHIMPQHLSEEWMKELGSDAEEIHEKYLNTLSNLSLSSQQKNSEMSNKSFQEKKNALLGEGSKFKVLNQMLENCDKFTEMELKDRGSQLGEKVLNRYSLETVDTRGIRFEAVTLIPLENEVQDCFAEATPLFYQFLMGEKEVDCYIDLYCKVVTELATLYPEKMKELADQQFKLKTDMYPLLTNAKSEYAYEITDSIYLRHKQTTLEKLGALVALILECGHLPGELRIGLKTESIKILNMIKKADKVKLIRDVLSQLNEEGVLIYNYETMPNSDSWIKFQLSSFNELFNDTDYHAWWDNAYHPSSMYFEYVVKRNVIYATLKKNVFDNERVRRMIQLSDLGEILKVDDESYWHFLKFDVDFKKVVLSMDKASVLKEELQKAIKEFELKSYIIKTGFDL